MHSRYLLTLCAFLLIACGTGTSDDALRARFPGMQARHACLDRVNHANCYTLVTPRRAPRALIVALAPTLDVMWTLEDDRYDLARLAVPNGIAVLYPDGSWADARDSDNARRYVDFVGAASREARRLTHLPLAQTSVVAHGNLWSANHLNAWPSDRGGRHVTSDAEIVRVVPKLAYSAAAEHVSETETVPDDAPADDRPLTTLDEE